MSRLFFAGSFVLGAIAILWMGSAFIGSNLLALTVTAIIAVVYVIGFAELVQYRQATYSLSAALGTLNNTESGDIQLDNWLSSLHQSLRNTVRLRIEGERVGLPSPVVTPYLVGLLVMLGLLGTFLGMVDTLQGAVAALEGTTELEAIRAGLAAPINGLGLAFGTSVAGVAASAMLGLSSTLSRRQRMNATRDLDTQIAGVFREFSLVHNRQQTFKAMQLQANALPEVAERLQTLAGSIENMGERLGDKLIENQQHFHSSVQTLYSDLANSVDQSLQKSVAASGQQAADSGRLAAESIKPLLQQLMQDIGRETEKTHQQLTATATQQLESLGQRFADTSEQVSSAWQQGLNSHEQANAILVEGISTSFTQFNTHFEQGAQSLLATLDQSANQKVEQQAANDKERLDIWHSRFEQSQQQLSEQQQTAFTELSQEFVQLSAKLTEQWQQAGEQSLQQQQQLTDTAQESSTTMLSEVNRLMGASEALVNARIESEANWVKLHSDRMTEIATTLSQEFISLREQQSSQADQAIEQLSKLEATAASQLATLGKELEEPMTRLIATASETPKAAAEVIGHLRTEISNNIERDNSLLEERQRIMEQLNSLSSALEQSTSGQREAIELMVTSSSTLMTDLSDTMNARVDGEIDKLSTIAETFTGSATEIADNFAGSAIEMSSLGEAFTLAVNLFSESNGNLVENLNRIEQSLDKSGTRSDEQLAYYVAQAREIIDHSMASQQSIFEQLQQLGRPKKVVDKEALEEVS